MSGPRPYKPKMSMRGLHMNRNMTLSNTRRPYQSVLSSLHRTHNTLTIVLRRRLNPKRKYSDKQCARFATTGAYPTQHYMYAHTHIITPIRHGTSISQDRAIRASHASTNTTRPRSPSAGPSCKTSAQALPKLQTASTLPGDCTHTANNGRCTRPEDVIHHWYDLIVLVLERSPCEFVAA